MLQNAIKENGILKKLGSGDLQTYLTVSLLSFQHLRSNLTEYQPKLDQVLDDGKRLLFSVSCSDLESQLNQLGDRWLSNTSKVNKELHRLETILKHWTRWCWYSECYNLSSIALVEVKGILNPELLNSILKRKFFKMYVMV